MANKITKTSDGYSVEFEFNTLLQKRFTCTISVGFSIANVTKTILMQNIKGFNYEKYNAYKTSVTPSGSILVEVFDVHDYNGPVEEITVYQQQQALPA